MNQPLPEDATMEIRVNDEPQVVAQGTTVAGLLADLQIEVQRVAVERNRAIVRRAHHAETELQAGDRIEIVGFVGGG
jgi:thiamine biosynthesis protein ThiS